MFEEALAKEALAKEALAKEALAKDALAKVEVARAGGFGFVVGRGGHADALCAHGADTVVPDLAGGRGGPTPASPAVTVTPKRTRRWPGSADGAQGLPGELFEVELGVGTILSQQLGVGAALDDPAVVEYQDQVGGQDRGQAVGNGDRGAALH